MYVVDIRKVFLDIHLNDRFHTLRLSLVYIKLHFSSRLSFGLGLLE